MPKGKGTSYDQRTTNPSDSDEYNVSVKLRWPAYRTALLDYDILGGRREQIAGAIAVANAVYDANEEHKATIKVADLEAIFTGAVKALQPLRKEAGVTSASQLLQQIIWDATGYTPTQADLPKRARTGTDKLAAARAKRATTWYTAQIVKWKGEQLEAILSGSVTTSDVQAGIKAREANPSEYFGAVPAPKERAKRGSKVAASPTPTIPTVVDENGAHHVAQAPVHID